MIDRLATYRPRLFLQLHYRTRLLLDRISELSDFVLEQFRHNNIGNADLTKKGASICGRGACIRLNFICGR